MASITLAQPPIFIQQGEYSARLTRNITSLIGTEGVIGASDLEVSERDPVPAMQVLLSPGRALIDGDDIPNQGNYLVVIEEQLEVPIEPADLADDRIDLLILRVLDSDAGVVGDEAQVEVLVGTPAASPVPPAVPDTAIPVAEVLVQANVIAILDTDITDVRTFTESFLAPPLDLNDLEDVNVPAPADGDSLIYDSGAGEWVSAAPPSAPDLGDLGDVDTTGAGAGDVLAFDGSEWGPEALALGALSDVDTSGAADSDALVFDGTEWVAGAVGFIQEYDIGDTGPGGGIVFYVSPGGFLSGTDGNETICHYLEAWTADLGGFAWSGTTNATVGTGVRIGTGAANTARAVAQDNTADRAITVADSFTNNGLSDWFLPSKDELAEMWFHKTVIGGFTTNLYWSSSEVTENQVWIQAFSNGQQFSGTGSLGKQGTAMIVRPVRAF